MRKFSRLFLLTSISILIFYSLSCLPNSDQTTQDPPRDRQPPPPGNNRMGPGPDQEIRVLSRGVSTRKKKWSGRAR